MKKIGSIAIKAATDKNATPNTFATFDLALRFLSITALAALALHELFSFVFGKSRHVRFRLFLLNVDMVPCKYSLLSSLLADLLVHDHSSTPLSMWDSIKKRIPTITIMTMLNTTAATDSCV